MNIFRRVAQILSATRETPKMPGTESEKPVRAPTADWRQQRLAEAAEKYGKPFKCASDDLPREVIVGGKRLVAVPRGIGVTRILEEQRG
ncbi:MAG TPA: hypothetical protein VL180_09570 [Burkholderiales bacterium]|jgi:hypothetical protein|nr:hypothetical protein [Burkholderiales bacterium]